MEINDVMRKFEETIQNIEETNRNIIDFSDVLEKVNDAIRKLDKYVQINDAASMIKSVCDNTVKEFSSLKMINEKIIETQNILDSDVIKNINKNLIELNKYLENLKLYKNVLSDIRNNIDEIKNKDIEVLRKETDNEKNYKEIATAYKAFKEEMTKQFLTVINEVKELKEENLEMAREIKRVYELNEEILNCIKIKPNENYQEVLISDIDDDIPF